jgi:hypothetical protein
VVALQALRVTENGGKNVEEFIHKHVFKVVVWAAARTNAPRSVHHVLVTGNGTARNHKDNRVRKSTLQIGVQMGSIYLEKEATGRNSQDSHGLLRGVVLTRTVPQGKYVVRQICDCEIGTAEEKLGIWEIIDSHLCELPMRRKLPIVAHNPKRGCKGEISAQIIQYSAQFFEMGKV